MGEQLINTSVLRTGSMPWKLKHSLSGSSMLEGNLHFITRATPSRFTASDYIFVHCMHISMKFNPYFLTLVCNKDECGRATRVLVADMGTTVFYLYHHTKALKLMSPCIAEFLV